MLALSLRDQESGATLVFAARAHDIQLAGEDGPGSAGNSELHPVFVQCA